MKKYIIAFFVLLISFVSCKDDSSFKPQCTGMAYEMLCIMNKTQWKSTMGDTVRACLTSTMAVLPQDEPDFRLFSVSLNNFASQLKTHRNIFEIRIDKKQKKSTIYIKRNYMAKQQTFVRVVCSSEKVFFDYYEKNKYMLKKIFLDAELDRNKLYFKKYTDAKIFNRLKNKYNYSLRVPTGYNINKDTLGFVWISQETGKNSRGVFVYSYDYVDQDQFKQENIIAKRDEMLKRFVPGPIAESYMTSARTMDFVSHKIEQDSCYAIETRGLWEVKGDYMGGPFINLTILNQKTNKVVCIDGYVYAPTEHKRLMVRQVEAVIKSLEFIETQK